MTKCIRKGESIYGLIFFVEHIYQSSIYVKGQGLWWMQLESDGDIYYLYKSRSKFEIDSIIDRFILPKIFESRNSIAVEIESRNNFDNPFTKGTIISK